MLYAVLAIVLAACAVHWWENRRLRERQHKARLEYLRRCEEREE